jgi:hypothetical protein
MLLEARNFLLSQNILTFSRDHPTHCEVVMFKVEHSLPFNAKAKTEWSYTATPLTYLNGVNRTLCFHHFVTDK